MRERSDATVFMGNFSGQRIDFRVDIIFRDGFCSFILKVFLHEQIVFQWLFGFRLRYGSRIPNVDSRRPENSVRSKRWFCVPACSTL